jgi:hypothetical protein
MAPFTYSVPLCGRREAFGQAQDEVGGLRIAVLDGLMECRVEAEKQRANLSEFERRDSKMM